MLISVPSGFFNQALSGLLCWNAFVQTLRACAPGCTKEQYNTEGLAKLLLFLTVVVRKKHRWQAIGAMPRMIQLRANVPVSCCLIRSNLLASLVGALTVEAVGRLDHGNNDRQKIAEATRTEPPATGCHRDP